MLHETSHIKLEQITQIDSTFNYQEIFKRLELKVSTKTLFYSYDTRRSMNPAYWNEDFDFAVSIWAKVYYNKYRKTRFPIT